MKDVIRMIQGGANPQQIILNYLEQQMSGTPMGDNLIALAKEGNTKGIENFARNYMRQNGMDFDTEFNNFRKNFGL